MELNRTSGIGEKACVRCPSNHSFEPGAHIPSGTRLPGTSFRSLGQRLLTAPARLARRLERWAFRSILPQAAVSSPYLAIGLTAVLYFLTRFEDGQRTMPLIPPLMSWTGVERLDGPL